MAAGANLHQLPIALAHLSDCCAPRTPQAALTIACSHLVSRAVSCACKVRLTRDLES